MNLNNLTFENQNNVVHTIQMNLKFYFSVKRRIEHRIVSCIKLRDQLN